MKREFLNLAAVSVAACMLTACGGGGNGSGDSGSRIASVKVAGSFFSDSGTYGFKYTIQGSTATGAGSAPLWVDQIAKIYGKSLCSHFNGTGYTPNSSCTNFAVAGALIDYTNDFVPLSPLSIPQQIKQAGNGGFAAGDLLLIEAGIAEAAKLVELYLKSAYSDAMQPSGDLRDMLGTQIDASTLEALMQRGQPGIAEAGAIHMQALAKRLNVAIQTNALAKGAKHVAVLNLPSVVAMPHFRPLLESLRQQQGSVAMQQFQATSVDWIKAFNTQLAAGFSVDERVVIVDYYAGFQDQMTDPAKYKLTNVEKAACPLISVPGGVTYAPQYCTVASLSALTQPGQVDEWWKSYVFATGTQPTPYGHQLIANLALDALTRAGWN